MEKKVPKTPPASLAKRRKVNSPASESGAASLMSEESDDEESKSGLNTSDFSESSDSPSSKHFQHKWYSSFQSKVVHPHHNMVEVNRLNELQYDVHIRQIRGSFL